MKTYARVVVIGGKVVGCSVLFHLTKFGWRDVVLVERAELTAGSSWHAAGAFHTCTDTNMAALQGYTINLYRELEALSDLSRGLHQVGGTTATTPERMDYLRATRAKHRHMGLDTHLIGPEGIRKRADFVNTDGVLGALWDPLDGHLDPAGTTFMLRRRGAPAGGRDLSANRGYRTNPDGQWRNGGSRPPKTSSPSTWLTPPVCGRVRSAPWPASTCPCTRSISIW